MIRQAHTYLVGAVSGATLIAIAIAAFVLLVSLQVFESWPIAALGDGGGPQVGSVSAGTAAGGGAARLPAVGVAARPRARARGARRGSSRGGAGGPRATAIGAPGGQGGSATPNGGGGGGGAAPRNGSAPGSGTASRGSSPGSGGEGPAPTTPSSPSSKATSTVSETVNQVDETALGGTLQESGATPAAEESVNGVAGPESTVGKTVDETSRSVEGVLGAAP